MPQKKRIDELLVDRGLAGDVPQAKRMVMAGEVRVEGQLVHKPSMVYLPDANVTVEEGPRYVSRGGEKLAGAFERFPLDVTGQCCADVGASTGGFTDCLLQKGARKVFAIDVGYGLLAWKLRQDERVVVMERTNARYVYKLPEPVTFITMDASFISLKRLLPVSMNWFPDQGGQTVALVKPQFEAQREEAAAAEGVIRDREVHLRVLREVIEAAHQVGYQIQGLTPSPLKGPDGNVEYLAWFILPAEGDVAPQRMIESAVPDLR